MTYSKDNLAMAIELLKEIGDKVNHLAEEKGITQDEAAEIVRNSGELDEELISFLKEYKEPVLQAIAIQESKNETKH